MLVCAGVFWCISISGCKKSETPAPAQEAKKAPPPPAQPMNTAPKPTMDAPKKDMPPATPPPTTVKLAGQKVNGTATIDREKVTVEIKGADPGQYAVELYRNADCKAVDKLQLPPEAASKAKAQPNAPTPDKELGVVSVGKDKTGKLETQVKDLKVDKNEEIVVYPKPDPKSKSKHLKASACGIVELDANTKHT
jgi:hypothetical protein